MLTLTCPLAHQLDSPLTFVPALPMPRCRHSDVSLPPGVPEPYTARLSNGFIYDISVRGECGGLASSAGPGCGWLAAKGPVGAGLLA